MPIKKRGQKGNKVVLASPLPGLSPLEGSTLPQTENLHRNTDKEELSPTNKSL
ncbi:MAG: hypothetical protein ANABAC_2745 [Anaerolineae bacterium]|nr:MAG: hypothetical protein ANABAC_2745 [Anaerolineae bacterium]